VKIFLATSGRAGELIGARHEISSGVSGKLFARRTTMGQLPGRMAGEITGIARIGPSDRRAGSIMAWALDVRIVCNRHRWLLTQIYRDGRGQNLDSCAGRTASSSSGTGPLVHRGLILALVCAMRMTSTVRKMSSAAPLCAFEVYWSCIVSPRDG